VKLVAAAQRAIKSTRLSTFSLGRPGLRHGVGAAVEHRRAVAGLDVATIVDGSDKGQFALLPIEVFPRETIFCFEPLKEPAAGLREMLGPEIAG
jgi:hypothetical protein